MAGTSDGAKKRWANEKLNGNIESVRARLSKAGQATGAKGFGSETVGSDGLTGKERAEIAAQESARKRAGGDNAPT